MRTEGECILFLDCRQTWVKAMEFPPQIYQMVNEMHLDFMVPLPIEWSSEASKQGMAFCKTFRFLELYPSVVSSPTFHFVKIGIFNLKNTTSTFKTTLFVIHI